MRIIRRHTQRLFGPNWRLCFVLMAFLVSGCATTGTFTTTETAKIDRLLELIKERLDVAYEVARSKWNTKAAIEDLSREKQIIDVVAKRATKYGLDSKAAAPFFRGQIEASKVVQKTLHAQWASKGQPPFAKVADLDKDLRPVLDRLTSAMMQALAEAMPALKRSGSRRLLEERSKEILGKNIGGDVALREAVGPLLELSR